MMFKLSRLLLNCFPRGMVGAWGAGLIVLAIPFLGQSEEILVILQNGDRLTGTNLVQEADSLSLDTALGKITIPRQLVQSTESKEPKATTPAPEKPEVSVSPEPAPPAPVAPVKPKVEPQTLAQQYQELLSQYESGTLSPNEYHTKRLGLVEQMRAAGLSFKDLNQPLPAKEPPPAAVATAKTKTETKTKANTKPVAGGSKPKIKSQFSGEARIGTDLHYGTKDQQIYSAKLKGVHTWGRLKNSADYLFTYGRADGDLSANRMDGSLKSDWQLTERLYTYNLGGAGYDVIRKVELRYEMGPGMGYHLFKKKGFIISGESGLHYQKEQRRESEDHKRFYYRFADIASWTINSKLSVDQKFEWLPQVKDFYNYQLRLEANVRYKLAENLSLVLTVLNRYQTDPANNVDNNDLQVRSSIGVTF